MYIVSRVPRGLLFPILRDLKHAEIYGMVILPHLPLSLFLIFFGLRDPYKLLYLLVLPGRLTTQDIKFDEGVVLCVFVS